MRCPTCRKKAECIDSRDSDVERIQFRRRRWRCGCGQRFTTAEFVVAVGDSRGHVRSIQRWLDRIRRQGAADLIAKLEALINPGESDGRLTNERRRALQALQADPVAEPDGLALADESEQRADRGGVDRGLPSAP